MYRNGLADGGDAVTEHGQPLALAELIRETAGVNLHQAGGGLSQTIDQTDDGRPGIEHVGQEERDQVEDHLRGDVGEEGGGRHHPHVDGQTAQAVPALGGEQLLRFP